MPATDSTTIPPTEPKRERSFQRCTASRTATNKAPHSNAHSAKPPRWRKWRNRRGLEPRSAALSTRYLFVTSGTGLSLEFYRSRLRPLNLLVHSIGLAVSLNSRKPKIFKSGIRLAPSRGRLNRKQHRGSRFRENLRQATADTQWHLLSRGGFLF
jgi:hypothetical protein